MAPRILKLSTEWSWVISFTPRPLFLQVKLQTFYIHGSVHRELNLIIFQKDATYSVGTDSCVSYDSTTHMNQFQLNNESGW